LLPLLFVLFHLKREHWKLSICSATVKFFERDFLFLCLSNQPRAHVIPNKSKEIWILTPNKDLCDVAKTENVK
jgi:hypothetical protein